jgi:hypothetical protein
VFFAEFLATAGLFDRWVQNCPLSYTALMSMAVIEQGLLKGRQPN